MSKVAHNRVDLTGRVFGNWRIESYSHTKNRQPFWNCLCIKCNKIYTVGSNSLRNGSKGCFSCKVAYGRPPEFDPEEMVTKQVFARYKVEARNRGYVFKIPFDLFHKLTQSNCFYCNSSPGSYGTNKKQRSYYNGLDRVDNSKGYLLNNVVPCCKPCNTKKLAVTKEMIATLYNILWCERSLAEDELIFDPDSPNYDEL